MNASRVLAVAAWLIALGCGDKVTVNETERGGASESCRSRNDCQEGLLCIDMVCTAGSGSGAGPNGPTDAGAAGTTTRSALGESCQTRADCVQPLVCIDNTCLSGFAPDAAVQSTPPRSKRGESCQAANDCDQGLACIASRCLESDFNLDFIPKQCFRVQCAADADCCKDWKPGGGYTQTQCDTMKDNCEAQSADAGLALNDCYYWVSYCRCSYSCLEEQCAVDTGQYCLIDAQCTTGPAMCEANRCVACAEDTDCALTGLPYCAANACVQCKDDGDCTTPGSRCVEGTCQAGCTANENCGLLQACTEGKCVDTGCASDRQCYFLTGDDRSRCVATKCQTPCANDAECVDSFHICSNGVCEFAGCDSDEECRAVLGLQNVPSGSLDRAVCRAPE